MASIGTKRMRVSTPKSARGTLPPSASAAHLLVGLRDRRRHPQGGRVLDQPEQRGHQSPAPARPLQLAIRTRGRRSRAPCWTPGSAGRGGGSRADLRSYTLPPVAGPDRRSPTVLNARLYRTCWLVAGVALVVALLTLETPDTGSRARVAVRHRRPGHAPPGRRAGGHRARSARPARGPTRRRRDGSRTSSRRSPGDTRVQVQELEARDDGEPRPDAQRLPGRAGRRRRALARRHPGDRAARHARRRLGRARAPRR